MKFDELLAIVGDEPLFETGILLAGGVDPKAVRQQLGRWTARGDLIQLRRGVYALAEPYRKMEAHPFVVANTLAVPSYVSLQSALRYHDMIPEHVPTTTSVTTRRPSDRTTGLGSFVHRHLDRKFFWGYVDAPVRTGQTAFVATPEKALLDLVHLVPGGDDPRYLQSLRLQNLEALDLEELARASKRWDRPKQRRAADVIADLATRARDSSDVIL